MSQAKEWVTERYGAIAREAQSSCCEAPAPAGERIGYRREDLAAAPAGADLGLGCGNPVALAGIEPGETVLDLGCGAGLDVFLAAARVGPTGRVIGVDMTPEMIQRARANAAAAGYTNVEFHLGDIESLPLPDASVDLVMSNCVLCLAPDKARAFGEIARVLRPGGRIAIADIVLDGALPDALRGDADAYCSCVSGAAPRAEYLAGLAAAGLQEVCVASEADAAELLAADCCGSGARAADLRGVVTSLHITARKPSEGD